LFIAENKKKKKYYPESTIAEGGSRNKPRAQDLESL
jgi:hypothetical protein